MPRFNLSRWLKKLSPKKQPIRRMPPRTRLVLEEVEDRVVPANLTYDFVGTGATAAWNVGANWRLNNQPLAQAPTLDSSDTVNFNSASTTTVTSIPSSVTVGALIFSQPNITVGAGGAASGSTFLLWNGITVKAGVLSDTINTNITTVIARQQSFIINGTTTSFG